MLLREAKSKLKAAGYRIIESTELTVEDVVRTLGNEYDLTVETINVNGTETTVFAGNGKDGYLKVVEGDDGQVYITFLNDAGVPAGKPSALISSLEDIDAAI